MSIRRVECLLALLCALQINFAHASIFAHLQGVVHDPQHRPLAGAHVAVHASHSAYAATAETDAEGGFDLSAMPLGEYTVSVAAPGFASLERTVVLASGTTPMLHFELKIGTVQESATAVSEAETANVDAVTPTTLIDRLDIANTPGADRTNSLQMITDFVPGAYITHDMLHMRGGHQVSWQIDGVQIPNTNIASNLGAQIDPKDIDYVEVQRGSYGADLGDRTYGVFNVVPRTGFEREREGELVLSLGNFLQTNEQVSLGSHSERFAYYASANGNRSDYGLSPAVATVRHDATNGYGGFGSLIYNRTPRDQFRFVSQIRRDFFQIPYDPDPNSTDASHGLRDGQHEMDGLVDSTWAHTFSGSRLSQSALLQVSPFYHFNRADYEPFAGDAPIATISDRSSNYAGLQASLTGEIARNTVQAGGFGFGQHDGYRFGAVFNDGSAPLLAAKNDTVAGGVVEEFISDQWKVMPWLTLTGGLRQTRFTGEFTEDATSPRVGAAVRVPKLGWVLRGFYGRFYQPPPLLTAAGPIVGYANSQNTTFQPLHGERDEEHQFGVAIPLAGVLNGWMLDADTFKTRANNFLDHANIGASSLYYPITIDGALIRGWELTVRSPRLPHGGQAHVAYSNQIGEQRGGLTGGLVCFPIASDGCAAGFSYHPLDHDQRNTLSLGYATALPFRVHASTNVAYGSGFHNGLPDERYPSNYLPSHTSVDVSVSREVGSRATVSASALNLLNQRTLMDNSLTFGGFHFSDPRQLYGEVRYRFKY